MSNPINTKKLSDNLEEILTGIPFADEGQSKVDEDLSEEEDQFPGHPTRITNPRKTSLKERRNAGNALFIKIPSQDKESDNDEDDKTPEVGESNLKNSRRNSISMPALNAIDIQTLESLKSIHDAAISGKSNEDDVESVMSCSIGNDRDTTEVSSSSEDEKPHAKKSQKKPLFRTKRRSSIAPLPALRLNDNEIMANELDSQSVITQNSVTSINSLASLLKEKMQMVPSMIKKKKKTSKDFKIKAFVACLFLLIVFLVGYAYIMYNQKVLAKMYFDRIKFNKETRDFKIFDDKDPVVTGRIGIMSLGSKPFRCLNENNLDPATLCFEWDGKARLYINSSFLSPTIPCYNIKWQALADHLLPTDCYDVDEEHDHWYGGGLTKESQWPFEKESFDFAPFITGDAKLQQWGNALKRYFINSRGVAISVDDKTPLYVSMNASKSRQFCLRAQNDDFAFVNRLTVRPELKYKICVSDNMKLLHQQMTQQSLWDGLNEKEVHIVNSLLEEPVWQIQAMDTTEMTQKSIENYTEEVIALGFLRLGHVLVNEFWQNQIGDFTLDKERFPTLKDTVNVLHRRGFKIFFTIQPFISTNSPNFGETVNQKLLIYERHSERSIPALTRYKSVASAGVIDMTNNHSIPWLIEKLEKLNKDYEIDGFFVDFGTSYNMPHYYQCSKSLDNPDQYKSIFLSNLDELTDVIGISSAIAVPKPPTFLSLPPVNSSWAGLNTVITAALSYGILGFPFIMPGPIGGDYYEHSLPKSLSFYSLNAPPLPEEELYIRWLQLATFLPVIRFTHLPSEYKSEFVMHVAKKLMAIRQKTVIPILKKYLTDAMNEALPFIRPLWMLDPQDPACLYVHDEFSVGIELIVAPILEPGQYKREVYLPQGVWKDGIGGTIRKGSLWLHNYRVPKDEVAYFIKMPDNTRF